MPIALRQNLVTCTQEKVLQRARGSETVLCVTNQPAFRKQLPLNSKGSHFQAILFSERILEGSQTQTKGAEMNGQRSRTLTLTRPRARHRGGNFTFSAQWHSPQQLWNVKNRAARSKVTPPPSGEEGKHVSESLLLYVLLMRNKCRQDVGYAALSATKMHRT